MTFRRPPEAAPVHGSPPIPRRLRLALATALLAAGAFSAPAMAESSARVVASIKPVHSLVSAVMAGTGAPYLVMQGAGSPHSFNIRPSDAAVLQEAEVIFLIGEGMETSLAGAVDSISGQARVVELSEVPGLIRRPFREGGAFEGHDHGHGHGHEQEEHEEEEHGDGEHGEEEHEEEEHGHQGHEGDDHGDEKDDSFDMHLWLDPRNAGAMARAIAVALSAADPGRAEVYSANAEALQGRLDDLSARISMDLAPVRDRPFIVFHDAYQHFEERFGLAAVGSAVVSAERSPGIRRIRDLREKLRELSVTCVVSEPGAELRVVNVIVEGTAARIGIVDPLGATIDSGPELYFRLLSDMAAAFGDCLAPEVTAGGE
ncbi:MAG: zinc ABC transporter substrate-binding protein [Proteobacteria bacterium]|nr:zinc ABC transporter substrate-binding protein [Pseudomonadota bacterium]